MPGKQNILNCWFWKKKYKSEDELETREQYNSEESLSNICNNSFNKDEAENYSQRIQQVPFPQDHVSLRKKKVKSYPTSPDRISHGDRGYLSDQKEQKKRKRAAFSEGTTVILTANSPQFSPEFKYKQDNSTEFPYQIPENSVPRRSSLFYGSVCEAKNSIMYVAEKPLEDHELPSTSKIQYNVEPDEYDANYTDSGSRNTTYGDDIKRRTVFRFRPGSTARAKPPGDLCKFMTFRAENSNNLPTTHNKYVRQFSFRPSNHSIILKTADGRLLQPVGTNKVRTSFISQRNSQIMRSSIVEPLNKKSFAIQENSEPIVYAVPVTTRRSSFRQSISQSPPRERSSSVSVEEPDHSLCKTDNRPEVYAVPELTRGRTNSVLQRSVKKLTSKTDNPAIYRKNIRYSMDTDVFSAERRRSSVKSSSPRYVKMEKGIPSNVSEFLAPITSLFVTDLKDPIPKDPLTKPKEYNNWVNPRRNSIQRQPPKSPNQSRKSSPKVTFKENIPKPSPSPSRKTSPKSYTPKCSSSSSSEEENDMPLRNRSNPYSERKHYVYAMEMPENILTNNNEKINKTVPLKTKDNKDIEPSLTFRGDCCGLNCKSSKIKESPVQEAPTEESNKPLSTDVQSEEEDIDLLCYPSEKFLRASILAAESGSKLRWRIIIKRGDN